MIQHVSAPLLASFLALTSVGHGLQQAEFVPSPCGVPIQMGSVCPSGFVQPPAGWYSGDTHDHIQLCFQAANLTAADIHAAMIATQQDVASALIWSGKFIDPSEFAFYAINNITGQEDPQTVGAPEILQFGVETSGQSVGNLGHLIGLNLTLTQADVFQLGLGCTPIYPDPGYKNDGSGDYGAPIFDLWRQNPEAVTGYAHHGWPVNKYVDAAGGGFDWEDPVLPSYVGIDAKCSFGQDLAFPAPKSCSNTIPSLAPFDTALGRLDFIESFDVAGTTCVSALEQRWFGMYYKLLSTGQRLSFSAGSDADCISGFCKPRGYVKLQDGDPFTYDSWTQALKAGRVSIARGYHQFIDMTVDGKTVGDELQLALGDIPPQVTVRVTYQVAAGAPPVSDTIEIIQDGDVVASETFGPLTGGTHIFTTQIPVSRSGWISSRLASYEAHSGSVYTVVNGRPVVSCQEAEYWMLYADFLNWNIDLAAAAGPSVLEQFVGCSENEIRDYIARGRKIYTAIRDYSSPPPVGIQNYGVSSRASCTQPIGIVCDDVPTAGGGINVRCFNAPPNAQGILAVSTIPDLGTPVLGATLYIGLLPGTVLLSVASNEGGYAERFATPLPLAPGTPLFFQFGWLNPPGCDASGLLSSSDAMRVISQP